MPILRQAWSRQRLTSPTTTNSHHDKQNREQHCCYPLFVPRIGLECRTADNLQCVITEGVPLSQYAVRKYTTEVTYNTVRGLFWG